MKISIKTIASIAIILIYIVSTQISVNNKNIRNMYNDGIEVAEGTMYTSVFKMRNEEHNFKDSDLEYYNLVIELGELMENNEDTSDTEITRDMAVKYVNIVDKYKNKMGD